MDIPLALEPCTGCHCFSSSFGKVFSVEFTKTVFIISTQLKIFPGTCSLSIVLYLLREYVARLLSSISSIFLGREYENTEPLG